MNILRTLHILFLLISIPINILWSYFVAYELIIKDYFPQFLTYVHEVPLAVRTITVAGWTISIFYLLFYTRKCKKHENPINKDPSKLTTTIHVVRNYNHYKDKAISNSKQPCLYPTECLLLAVSGAILLLLSTVAFIINLFH